MQIQNLFGLMVLVTAAQAVPTRGNAAADKNAARDLHNDMAWNGVLVEKAGKKAIIARDLDVDMAWNGGIPRGLNVDMSWNGAVNS
ncbi:hypothetical protein EYZ11_001161 [Aspergillus tanneri]|uniref:Uncharacterized protein n=1 Tax=Aspergillus tanneri TaxID=1220188 RepID=A0A4S3JV90_9EURO|nr:hypothetical protein EYZ11_001161 [Aspergillus tanneri]